MKRTDRRGLTAEHTALGLALAAVGCEPPGPTLDDDVGDTGTDATSGNDDPSGTSDTDTGPNDIPLELVLARHNANGKFVVLRFSEPMAPAEGIDPNDFRISFARLTSQCDYYGCVDQTTYWDPNFYASNYFPYQPYSGARFEVDLVTSGMQETDVFLRFEVPLDPLLCKYTQGYGGGYDVLFVHYSPGGGIPVSSSDGELLPAIGLQWVEQMPAPVWAVEGIFPNLDPKIAIPCTLEAP